MLQLISKTRLCPRVIPVNALRQVVSRSYSEPAHEFGITNIQDEADFRKRVTNNSNPVLVDFHATWCGPCKLLTPRLEQAMDSYMDKVLLARVDVDRMDSVAAEYKISAVPTVIAMKNGKEMKRFTGLKEKDFIQGVLQSLCN